MGGYFLSCLTCIHLSVSRTGKITRGVTKSACTESSTLHATRATLSRGVAGQSAPCPAPWLSAAALQVPGGPEASSAPLAQHSVPGVPCGTLTDSSHPRQQFCKRNWRLSWSSNQKALPAGFLSKPAETTPHTPPQLLHGTAEPQPFPGSPSPRFSLNLRGQ